MFSELFPNVLSNLNSPLGSPARKKLPSFPFSPQQRDSGRQDGRGEDFMDVWSMRADDARGDVRAEMRGPDRAVSDFARCLFNGLERPKDYVSLEDAINGKMPRRHERVERFERSSDRLAELMCDRGIFVDGEIPQMRHDPKEDLSKFIGDCHSVFTSGVRFFNVDFVVGVSSSKFCSPHDYVTRSESFALSHSSVFLLISHIHHTYFTLYIPSFQRQEDFVC